MHNKVEMYCTIQDGAKMLKVTRPTVYRMIRDGELARHKVLGRPALKVAQIKRILAQEPKRNGSVKENR